MSAWDRQPKEPSRAYAHFCVYRDMGAERSLAKVGQIRGVHPNTLAEMSEAHGWVQRCDQWDAHLRAVHDRALITEAARQGKERAKAYSKLLEKARTALDGVDVTRCTLQQVAQAMKIACEGIRLEEGLATSAVSLEVQDARAILSRFPAPIRQGLLRLLAADVGAAGVGRDPYALPGRDRDAG